MSFVDLTKSDVWSEVDIVNRTESMIASEFPPFAVAILTRKSTGALLGQYVLTPWEQGELLRYAQVCEAARAAGNDARADMALLAQVLALEAQASQVSADEFAALLAAAEPAVVELFSLRNPEPQP